MNKVGDFMLRLRFVETPFIDMLAQTPAYTTVRRKAPVYPLAWIFLESSNCFCFDLKMKLAE